MVSTHRTAGYSQNCGLPAGLGTTRRAAGTRSHAGRILRLMLKGRIIRLMLRLNHKVDGKVALQC